MEILFHFSRTSVWVWLRIARNCSPMAQKPQGKRSSERMMIHSDAYGMSTPVVAQAEERIRQQSSTGIEPNDVLCGRGKESFNHGE